jgi:hypothetical protein
MDYSQSLGASIGVLVVWVALRHHCTGTKRGSNDIRRNTAATDGLEHKRREATGEKYRFIGITISAKGTDRHAAELYDFVIINELGEYSEKDLASVHRPESRRIVCIQRNDFSRKSRL